MAEQFSENALGRSLGAVPIGMLDRPKQKWFGGQDLPTGHRLKRGMDLVIASLAIVLLSPIMLAVAGLIRCVMGGPVIFAQQRVGLNGTLFVCYKFRTMRLNAEDLLVQHLAANPEAAAEWEARRKLMEDPRVGCLGNILRKSSLDELPQLFNVLRGEMSLVGPRPIVPGELHCYGAYARECFKAKPGLTGIWQVSGRNRLSYSDRVALDRYYARKWSVWLDLAVLTKTIPAVLKIDNTA